MSDKRSIRPLSWLFGLISIGFALALLLSCLSIFISPEKFWPLQFLGIAFPYLAGINLIIFVIWLLRWRKYAIYALIALTPSLIFVPRYYGFADNTASDNHEIGMLSYNVHVFSKWKYGKDDKQKIEHRDTIVHYIERIGTDIACLQEFYSRKSGPQNNVRQLAQVADLKHHYKIPYRNDERGYYIATFSKYPIINSGSITIEEHNKNFCAFTDLEISERKIVRVYNVHLKSLNINNEEYLFTGELNLRKESDQRKAAKGTRSIIRNMKRAFEIRSKQVEAIQKHMQNCPHPIILAGDFNDTPLSYAYQAIKGDLQDAFIISGKGFSETYVGKFPSFRIDYILHNDEIESSGYRREMVEYSDHYPIHCRMTLVSK